jgi:hypothetical protein
MTISCAYSLPSISLMTLHHSWTPEVRAVNTLPSLIDEMQFSQDINANALEHLQLREKQLHYTTQTATVMFTAMLEYNPDLAKNEKSGEEASLQCHPLTFRPSCRSVTIQRGSPSPSFAIEAQASRAPET